MTVRARLALPLALLLLPGLLAPSLAAQAPGVEQRRTLDAGGSRRSYLLYLPSSWQRGRPLPLVLVFHGAGGRSAGMARHTGFSRVAEREGFAVVYPDGVGRRWNDGRGIGGARDDVGFVRLLVDSLERELGIDPRRVYATGISNGAVFAHRLACDLPGVLAAIAPVAGAVPAGLAERCGAAAPVAVVAFQGTADRFMPYEGGGVALRGGAVLSAARSAGFWARVNGCADGPEDAPPVDSVTDGTRLRREAYFGCRENRSVVLYTIEGGGHTWPGGPPASRRIGRASREIDATGTIWDFFQRHPRT
jgi:polyhydroxybutyrate depolymerase